MTNSDRPEFVTVMMSLAAVFRIVISEAGFEGYWLGLRDLELEAFSAAAAKALRSCKFMPAPAELRDLAGVETSADLAESAWIAVHGAVRRHGRYTSVDFGPATNAAVRAVGGWQRLCSADSYDFPFLKKAFLRRHERYQDTGVAPEEGGPLGALAGFHAPPVKVSFGSARENRPKLASVPPGPDDESEEG